LGVAGSNPAFEHPENNVPPGPDEMLLETITPHQRGNTLDPEVRNPALKGGEGSRSHWSRRLTAPVLERGEAPDRFR
jgi:hypothetical protein